MRWSILVGLSLVGALFFAGSGAALLAAVDTAVTSVAGSTTTGIQFAAASLSAGQGAANAAAANQLAYLGPLAQRFIGDVESDTGARIGCFAPAPDALPATQRDVVLLCDEVLAGLPL